MSQVALWQEHLVVGRYWVQFPAGSLWIFFLFLQSLHYFLPISLPVLQHVKLLWFKNVILDYSIIKSWCGNVNIVVLTASWQ